MDVKNTALSPDPLSNSRHEAFAREIASGRNATQAYLNVYGTKDRPSGPSARAARTRHVASTGGHRLLRRKSVAARIRALQQTGAAGLALDLQEIHAFLTRVVRTPAGDIVPSSDLCTRVKHLRDGATDVWMPNKLACLRLSAKLQGFLDKSSSPAPTPADPAPPKSPQPDTPPILTEEHRQILIAQRRAIIQAQRLAEEKHTAEEQNHAEENRRCEAPPVQPEPIPPRPNRPGFAPQPYFGQSFRNRSQLENSNARPSNPSQQRPSFTRVTPDSSS
ncbi:MAG TPA: hypothetical protein VGM54_05280 [Chthoniobacter sp.]|jgi:hypothetical protein